MKPLPTILYIDDEYENLLGFEVSYADNFNIITSTCASEGQQLLKTNDVAIAIVDYKMPNEDGVSFIERVHGEFPDVVFMVISGFADLEIVLKALNLNCLYSFIQKPWNYNELKIVLNNAHEAYRMRKENKDLLQKLILKNKALEESIEREKKLNELKTVFLQNLSHEIRTPLNSIIGFSTLARDRIKDPELQQNLNYSIQSSYSLLKVVEEIICASMIVTNQLTIKNRCFQLNRTVREIMLQREDRVSDKKNIQFINEIADDVILCNDKEKVYTIIDLMIDNAFKFTEKGMVKISSHQVGDEVIVKLEDTGIGIEKERFAWIFEPFRQGDESSIRKYGGNGLGLYIVKSFVELLGGSVWCESTLGTGTSFYFTLLKNSEKIAH